MILSNEQQEIYLKATNSNLPFYNVVNLIANFLGTLPFVQQSFNNSIYIYGRRDNPTMGLPAINITNVGGNSRSAGWTNSSVIQIDVIRNMNTTNRASMYNFKQSITERIVQSLLFNNNFRGLLERYVPYINLFGNDYSVNTEQDIDTSRISIELSYYFNGYKIWADQQGFNSEGRKTTVAQPTKLLIKSTGKIV